MNAFDIAGLVVGAGIIVAAKMLATGFSLIGVYAMRTEDKMRKIQEEVLSANR